MASLPLFRKIGLHAALDEGSGFFGGADAVVEIIGLFPEDGSYRTVVLIKHVGAFDQLRQQTTNFFFMAAPPLVVQSYRNRSFSVFIIA